MTKPSSFFAAPYKKWKDNAENDLQGNKDQLGKIKFCTRFNGLPKAFETLGDVFTLPIKFLINALDNLLLFGLKALETISALVETIVLAPFNFGEAKKSAAGIGDNLVDTFKHGIRAPIQVVVAAAAFVYSLLAFASRVVASIFGPLADKCTSDSPLINSEMYGN